MTPEQLAEIKAEAEEWRRNDIAKLREQPTITPWGE